MLQLIFVCILLYVNQKYLKSCFFLLKKKRERPIFTILFTHIKYVFLSILSHFLVFRNESACIRAVHGCKLETPVNCQWTSWKLLMSAFTKAKQRYDQLRLLRWTHHRTNYWPHLGVEPIRVFFIGSFWVEHSQT